MPHLVAIAIALQSYAHGVFVATPHGPVELTAYAEVARNGQLRMAKGSLENVPTIDEVRGILCNLPSWQPGSIFIASDLIFQDYRAERREIPFAVRRRSISALEVKVEDVERQERLAGLIRAVGGSDEVHAYVFVVMTTNGLERLYPFRVKSKVIGAVSSAVPARQRSTDRSSALAAAACARRPNAPLQIARRPGRT